MHRSIHTTAHRVIHSTPIGFARFFGLVIHRFVWFALPTGASGRQTRDVTTFGAFSTSIAIIIIS